MAKKPLRGNYLTLENVRVSYDENSDTIHLTSKDKDLPKGKGFHLTLNGGREGEMTLREMMQNFGYISESNQSILPLALDLEKDSIDRNNPYMFPIGQIGSGKELSWDVDADPHLVLLGGTGSGKSVTTRLLFLHCIKHSEYWSIKAVDLKRIELMRYLSQRRDIEIATTLLETKKLVTSIVEEIDNRYEAMKKEGVTRTRDLIDFPKSIMFIIDEIGSVLAVNEYTDSVEAIQIKRELIKALEEIVRNGPRAGVHLVTGSQGAEFMESFNSKIWNSFMRISMGRAWPNQSIEVFGNNAATRINHRIHGRGYYQNSACSEEGPVQIYYSPIV